MIKQIKEDKNMAMTKEDKALVEIMKKETGREAFKCSICGGFFYGWGNNPWPVTTEEGDRCCDACNDTQVIPARIELMLSKRLIKKGK